MADKKITALTELSATGKAGEDFLHIIDYGGGSSPVNKKISLTNLFNNANVDTHIYGASKTLEVGFAAATNSHLKVATGANATTDGSVVVNDDGTDYVDFIVKSKTSDQAIKVDAGTDKVIVNGDAVDCDFTVSGENVAALLHVDAGTDAVGIVKAAPDTNFSLTVGATGTNGIKSEGSVDVTGAITASTNFTVGGELIKFTTTRIGTSSAATTALAGGADGSEVVIPVDSLITHLNPANTTNAYYSLAAGAAGQLKFIMNITAHDVHIESATIGGASGTEIRLDANECCMLLYSGGSGGSAGWWNIGGGTAVA